MINIMIILFAFFSFSIKAKEIAISFDDSPTRNSSFQTGLARTNKIIASLKEAGVKEAIFFANSGKIKVNNKGKERLLNIARAGHIIANHTHTHPNLHKIKVSAFIKDIEKADKLLANIPNFKKYFRYPYLNNGKTNKERKEVLAFLTNLGYKHGYVTVDNYDWYLDFLFRKAFKAKKKINYKKLKDFYVKYLTESIEFYDDMAIKVLGRSPKHVLLLHENDLASLYIKDLIIHLKAKGWKIISPDDAYSDNIAKQDPDMALGQGRVTRIAKAKKYRGKLSHYLENEKKWEGLLEKLGVFK